MRRLRKCTSSYIDIHIYSVMKQFVHTAKILPWLLIVSHANGEFLHSLSAVRAFIIVISRPIAHFVLVLHKHTCS